MFDEQFHNFISSTRTTTPPPTQLPFLHNHHHHGTTTSSSTQSQHHHPNFLTFDPLFFPSHHPQSLLQQQHIVVNKSGEQQKCGNGMGSVKSGVDGGDTRVVDVSWTGDEVLALMRVKSNLENWYPDFTWEHVSRKLAELGYKRSADKCKEKYEEETCRNFNPMAYNKNTRFLVTEELEDHLFHGTDNHQNQPLSESSFHENNQAREALANEDEKNHEQESKCNEDARDVVMALSEENEAEKAMTGKKRKRKSSNKKIEMFKGLCVDIVKKIMAKQEEMHKKLLEEMVQRDEEKIAREEAWKRQETERFNREIEIRAREQVLAGERQSKIIEFIKKFSSGDQVQFSLENVVNKDQNTLAISLASEIPKPTSSAMHNTPQDQNSVGSLSISSASNGSMDIAKAPPLPSQNAKSVCIQSSPLPPTTSTPQNPPSNAIGTETMIVPFLHTLPHGPQDAKSGILANPLSTTPSITSQNPNSRTSNAKEDTGGKRWPRDEVLALINIRSSLNDGNNSSNDEKEGSIGNKGGSLWERISQAMLELGYKRSAKRCKEKWENINKYFRKTKDMNKKRSADSRTCPYFDQLSALYNQGVLPPASVVSASNGPAKNCLIAALPENHSKSQGNS